MYATYQIDVNDIPSEDYTDFKKFITLQETDADLFKSTFQSLESMEEILKAEDILKSWFPLLKKQVFISHSHQDEEEALKLAAWLYQHFDIECFIDSQVWGYSADLQKKIDDEYCKNYGDTTYNYNKRNISTSHVHMLLNTALQNMIDSCECIIFINSNNSVRPLDSIENGEATYSPWIYGEILSTKILRRRKPEDHPGRLKPTFESMVADSERKELIIEYPLTLNHLYVLDRFVLNQLKDNFQQYESLHDNRRLDALDYLYQITEIPTIKSYENLYR